ncbi:TetR family transcriptional regulator [Chryseolinea sp. T2]|uniref:TetR/AcrR family transcriptional regulator n=1 Tax=Chryseolinea sp. T2 TaxID=3129255 RepID=UPI003077707B
MSRDRISSWNMAKKKKATTESLSTEEKIKAAASAVFTRKGYAATRTRDIAEEAGMNLALLNYYFRSKEKLFEIVMVEKMTKFFSVVWGALENKSMTLEEKTSTVVENYIDLLSENPDLPIFILSEVRMNPAQFASRFSLAKVLESDFMKQIRKQHKGLHPLQFMMNLLGLVVFPFVMKPVLEQTKLLSEKDFKAQMAVRKKLIPKWMKAILATI